MVSRLKPWYANHGRMAQKTHGMKNLQLVRKYNNKKSRRNNRHRGVLLRDCHFPVNDNTPTQLCIWVHCRQWGYASVSLLHVVISIHFMLDIQMILCNYPAKRRCLFSLFASTAFQVWRCVPVPLRMSGCGKRERQSFQGCKHPHRFCPISGYAVAPHTLSVFHFYILHWLQHG